MKMRFLLLAVVICALSAAAVNALKTQTRASGLIDQKEAAQQEIINIRIMRAEDEQKLVSARFEKDGVIVTDSTDRLLFEYEEIVNRFLSIPMKTGLGRVIVAHYSNPRLASHGGVMSQLRPGDDRFGESSWQLNGRRYALTRPWGLIGALVEPVPQAWLFRLSPSLKVEQDEKNDSSDKPPKPEAYPLNRFEEYALSMLRKGEKLVRWEREDVMLAVGAVRAEAVCLRCHDGAAGDLLGAFTYSYAKTKAVEPDAQTKQILQWNREGQKLDQIAASLNLFEKSLDGKASGRMHRYQITQALLGQGIVTAEMLEMQAGMRHHVLQTDLGPTKKPGTGGAE